MESNTNSVTKGDDNKPISLGTAAMDLSWLFSSGEENLLVTIKCGQKGDKKTFPVLKPILIKHSEFFDECLRNPCKESKSLTVKLPGVPAGMMMLYLTVANRQALMNCTSEDTLVKCEDFAHPDSIEEHADFYRLCDFLQNEKLAKSTQKMLVDFLKSQRKVHNENDCPSIFRAYGNTFNNLARDHVVQAKLRRVLVKSFCCMASASNFFKHCKALKEYPDFLLEVAKQYALNSMWKDSVQKKAAEKIKTQRMSIDDESEPEPEPED
ncbi:hypothetical protein CGCVW01_v011004 [Colletotrichum viniferum]|nr:hypothetical protein CGCVW01_v011004 [Colletotrichum viniferum]